MTITEERTVSYAAVAERRIRQQLGRGDHFSDVEHYIEGLALESDHKSALWMLAWSELPLPERRTIIMHAADEHRADSRALSAQSDQARRQSRMLIEQAKRIGRKFLS